MIHAREDYNNLQELEKKIGKDEPVFIVRAHDKFAPLVMITWANAMMEIGMQHIKVQHPSGEDILNMAEKVYKHAKLTLEWQGKHGSKIPDLPKIVIPTIKSDVKK